MTNKATLLLTLLISDRNSRRRTVQQKNNNIEMHYLHHFKSFVYQR